MIECSMKEWMALGPVWYGAGERSVAISDKAPMRFEDRRSPHGAWGWQYGSPWLDPGHPATAWTIPRDVHDHLPDNPDFPEVARDRAAKGMTMLRWMRRDEAVAAFQDACVAWAMHRREQACSLVAFVDLGRQAGWDAFWRAGGRMFSLRNRPGQEWVRIAAFRPEYGICGEDAWDSWERFESGFVSAHQGQNKHPIDDYRHACAPWAFDPDARPPGDDPEAVLGVFGDVAEEAGHPDAGATARHAAEAVGRLRFDLGLAISLLRTVEWQGDREVSGGVCPNCWADEANGHHRGCDISRLLAEFPVE